MPAEAMRKAGPRSRLALDLMAALALLCAGAVLSACGAASPPDQVISSFTRLQHAVETHDVHTTCELLIPVPQSTPLSSISLTRITPSQIAANLHDCQSGFGKRGEFAAFDRGLRGRKIATISVTADRATVHLNGFRHGLPFGKVGGEWRLLIGVQ